jgi:hypothetical protein
MLSSPFGPWLMPKQKADLIVCLGGNDRAGQEKSLKLYKDKYAQKLLKIKYRFRKV